MPSWDKEIANRLTEQGMTTQQISVVLEIVLEHRQSAYAEGRKCGLNIQEQLRLSRVVRETTEHLRALVQLQAEQDRKTFGDPQYIDSCLQKFESDLDMVVEFDDLCNVVMDNFLCDMDVVFRLILDTLDPKFNSSQVQSFDNELLSFVFDPSMSSV